jgi:hypothetical protein
MSIRPGVRGLSPLECVCALGVVSFLVLIAAAPAHRTLTKARTQAHTIRHWDAHQAALADAVASGAPWASSTEATSAK